MERKKHIIAIILVLFVLSSTASNKTKIYQAYLNGNMSAWKTTIDEMQEAEKSVDLRADLLNYQYGYIGWCIGVGNEKEAKTYLKKAEANLETLEKAEYSASEINAYKSAFYGFKIGLSPVRAPFYGPKSVNHAKRAIEINKTNPMGYIQYGNSQFFMPPVFGGSKSEAVEYFEKALKLMEISADTLNNWNYLSLLTRIAEAHQEMGNYESAGMYYKKILQIEPGFSYVKNELYPAYLNEINQK